MTELTPYLKRLIEISEEKRSELLAGLSHQITAKREDFAVYEARERILNVSPPATATSSGVVDDDGDVISRRKVHMKEKVRGIFITDNNPCADPRLWFNWRCNQGTQRWRKRNVQNAFWAEDWAPTTGRRHIHCFIYLVKPELPWLLLKLLGTGVDLVPAMWLHEEKNRRMYVKKKAERFNLQIHVYLDGVVPTSLPRKRGETITRCASSASEGDTDSDGTLDLTNEVDPEEEFELRWNLIE